MVRFEFRHMSHCQLKSILSDIYGATSIGADLEVVINDISLLVIILAESTCNCQQLKLNTRLRPSTQHNHNSLLG